MKTVGTFVKKIIHFGIWFLFGIYCLGLIYFLFLDKIVIPPRFTFFEHIARRTNLLPLRTILRYYYKVKTNSINYDTVILKIGGDLVGLIPMGFFIGYLFLKINTLDRAIICGLAIVLFVELTQLLTMIGSFDVDNFILMMPGFMLGYIVSKSKIVLKCKEKCRIDSVKKEGWLSKKTVRWGAALMAVIALTATILVGSLSMFEETTVFVEDESNYIKFANAGDGHMDSDGSFEFMFQDWAESDHFIANKDEITITTTARMYVNVDNYYFDSSEYIYRLTLCKENGKEIGYYDACGDGNSGSETFITGVKKGEEYYFKLEVMDPYIDGTAYHFEGTGKVSNVTVI